VSLSDSSIWPLVAGLGVTVAAAAYVTNIAKVHNWRRRSYRAVRTLWNFRHCIEFTLLPVSGTRLCYWRQPMCTAPVCLSPPALILLFYSAECD